MDAEWFVESLLEIDDLHVFSFVYTFHIFTINLMPKFAFRVDEAGFMMLPFLCSCSPNFQTLFYAVP